MNTLAVQEKIERIFIEKLDEMLMLRYRYVKRVPDTRAITWFLYRVITQFITDSTIHKRKKTTVPDVSNVIAINFSDLWLPRSQTWQTIPKCLKLMSAFRPFQGSLCHDLHGKVVQNRLICSWTLQQIQENPNFFHPYLTNIGKWTSNVAGGRGHATEHMVSTWDNLENRQYSRNQIF